MSILATLRERFRPVLLSLVDSVDDLLDMIRPAQDPQFGDYQANLAMPLGKRLQSTAARGGSANCGAVARRGSLRAAGSGGTRFHQPATAESLAGRPAAEGRSRRAVVHPPGGVPAHDCRGLLVPQRGQGHARRPHSLDRDWRCDLSHAAVHGASRDQRQSSGGLGHAVRDDHLRLQAFRG